MEEGCRKRTVIGTAERARGINGIDVEPNNGHCNDDYNENNGGVQQDDRIAREIEAVCHRIVPEFQERNGFSDDQDSVENRTPANDNEASDNGRSRLNE
ncbi:hypothetical protein AHAS_Ahas16G0072200 [Arachis hypogaea]